jgi:hypothetical protein
MPHIKPKRYRVEYNLDGVTVEYEVRVITADILKAEETGPTYAISNPQTQPIVMTVMWVWAASVREGHIGKVSWPDFRQNLIDYEKSGDAPTVDPTQPAGLTLLPSPSPSDSEVSTSTDGSEQ